MPLTLISAQRADEQPVDVRTEARRLADKKIMRFLDALAAPAYMAAHVTVQLAALDLTRAALFTISRYDPDYTQPVLPAEWASGRRGVATYYQSLSVPTDWLRTMTNNVLCHVAVAHGIQGPNLHLAGGADALELALTLATDAIDTGAATAALLVAFDAAGGDDHAVAPAGRASAALVGAARAGDEPLAPVDPTHRHPTDALDAIIAMGRAATLQGMARAS